jgi:hypothetical protein
VVCEGGGGGAIAGKLEKALVLFVVAVPPHEFEVIEVPLALLQSIPELCGVLLYEGVVVGDVMLFILIVGLDCC